METRNAPTSVQVNDIWGRGRVATATTAAAAAAVKSIAVPWWRSVGWLVLRQQQQQQRGRVGVLRMPMCVCYWIYDAVERANMPEDQLLVRRTARLQ